MNVIAINRTIRTLCEELSANSQNGPDWRERTEEALLYEATVCIFSSQMIFEVAEAIAERLLSSQLLRSTHRASDTAAYAQVLLNAFSDPVEVEFNGTLICRRPRFKNRLASMLTKTVERIRTQRQTFGSLLRSYRTAEEARESLIDLVSGFGPKQASLFLRRIGYYSDFAVLDKHVLDYLRMIRGVRLTPGGLPRLRDYRRIEGEFQRVAEGFGYPVGCVDLAMWVTVRVAKREALW